MFKKVYAHFILHFLCRSQSYIFYRTSSYLFHKRLIIISYFCTVKFMELAFRLGVVFAIFAFIWGVFQLLIGLIRGSRKKTLFEEYLLKFAQYFFLVDVTFLFCMKKVEEGSVLPVELTFGAFILLLYFLGKFQRKQQRIDFMKIAGNKMPAIGTLFNQKAEIAAIIFALTVFVAFVIFPNYAVNPISNWFYTNITEIEQTFFFGFIFKVIGFFVLVGILLKLVNGISFLLSGKPFASVKTDFRSGKGDQNDFDDYEEIK